MAIVCKPKHFLRGGWGERNEYRQTDWVAKQSTCGQCRSGLSSGILRERETEIERRERGEEAMHR